MPIEFVGGTVTISAGGTGEIRKSFSRDGKIIQFMWNSTGRAKISKIEQLGVNVYNTGNLELGCLQGNNHVYDLPEPIDYKGKTDFVVSLENLEDSDNVVTFVWVIQYGGEQKS